MNKRKLASLVLASVFVASSVLTGCGSKSGAENNKSSAAAENKNSSGDKKDSSQDKKEVEEVKGILKEDVEETGVVNVNVESAAFEKTLQIDGVEHKMTKPDKTYLHVVSKVKNLGEETTLNKIAEVQGRYDSKYKCGAVTVIEGKEKGDTKLAKGEEATVHSLIEINEELQGNETPVEVLVNLPTAKKVVAIPAK